MTLSCVDTADRYILSQVAWTLSSSIWFMVLSSNFLLNRALAINLWSKTQLLCVILINVFKWATKVTNLCHGF